MAGPSSRSSATARRLASHRQAAGTPLLTCDAATTEAERYAHFRIRHQVFVIEQGLFGGLAAGAGGDIDARDHDPATIHVVGRAGEAICGTVRLYPLEATAGRWKGDRLAVLASHRHLGLGAPLVRYAVRTAGLLGGAEMEAFIQPANVAFFRWLGWRQDGGLVDYAGIPHQRMLIGLGGAPD